MKKVGEISLKPNQTETTKTFEHFTVEEFGQAIRMLLGYGKNAPAIGSTDFKIWHRSIAKTFTFAELQAAVIKLEDFTGYLDLGTLREYCKAARPPNYVKTLEHKPTLLTKEEKKKRIKKLRQELSI